MDLLIPIPMNCEKYTVFLGSQKQVKHKCSGDRVGGSGGTEFSVCTSPNYGDKLHLLSV